MEFKFISYFQKTKKQGERPFCCPMPNCRRRFATEPEVKKHIDNHMNPNSAKSRRLNSAAATAASMLNTATTNVATDAATKSASSFLTMDKQSNIIPRMGPVVKHELYFPQCYAPPFNQAFTQQQQAHSGSTAPTTSVPPTIPAPTIAQ